MSDVVVTVPRHHWGHWLGEGDLAGEAWTGTEWAFFIAGARPRIDPGERVYIVARGRLRGYALLERIGSYHAGRFGLIRRGGAAAVTIAAPIKGFRGFRYRWWKREDEVPFPDWQTAA